MSYQPAIPSYIDSARIQGAPADYAWGTDAFRAIRYPLDTEHPRLAAAFGRVNQRAAMLLMAGLAQWIAWRWPAAEGTSDLLMRAQACIAGSLDLRLAHLTEVTEKLSPATDEGPVQLARALLADAWKDYCSDDDWDAVNGWAFRMALLADYVVTNRLALEGWLSAALRRCAHQCPLVDDPVSQQALASPALLDPDAEASESALQVGIAQYLSSLSPQRNAYLRSAGADGAPS